MRTTLAGVVPSSKRQIETRTGNVAGSATHRHTSAVCPFFSIPVWAALVWDSTTARICALEAEVLGTFGVRIPRKTKKKVMLTIAGIKSILLVNEFRNAFMRSKSIPKKECLASNFFVYKQLSNRRF